MSPLYNFAPWFQQELLHRGVPFHGAVLTAKGRAAIIEDFDEFCSDQIKRVVNSLHETHRRVRLGPVMLAEEITEGRVHVEVRSAGAPRLVKRGYERVAA